MKPKIDKLDNLQLPIELIQWWEGFRPEGWSVEEHLQNPSINCTNGVEKRLAIYIAKKKYDDLAEQKALSIPVVLWRFCAYKSEKDYESGNYFFMRDFLDHAEMKVFSGRHSVKQMSSYPGYCSMYWKIVTNA